MRKRRRPGLVGLAVAVLRRGRAGAAFASALSKRGARVRTWSRGSGRPAAATIAGADLVLFCVRDDAIGLVAGELAAQWPAGAKPPVALHLSGYHGSGPLRALARRGWATGSMHPLVPLTGARSAADLEGAWFATSGRGAARTAARRVISGLRGREFRLDGGEERHHAWHLAVALVANGSVALFDAALSLAGDAAAPALASVPQRIPGRPEEGSRAALTGPVARGEAEVVAGHLALLRGDDARLYRLLAKRLLALSDLEPARRRAIARLLR